MLSFFSNHILFDADEMVKSLTTSKTDHNLKISQFYAENYQWLYGWLCKNLRSHNHVEDILQDTFLKIFIAPERLEQIREPRSYLTVTAKSIIISQARRKKIENDYLKHLAEQQQLDVDCSPEDLVIVTETLYRIVSALSGLEPRPREVMMLHYLYGMSQMSIAEKLGISRTTVQTDLIKAVMSCHRLMQQD